MNRRRTVPGLCHPGTIQAWPTLACDAEASYLADGEEVSTSLDDLDGDSVVHGLPACRIRSSAGQGLCPGLFCSMTTGGHIGYESLLELDRRWLADCDPQVEWIARQPMWMSGLDGESRRRHVPDLLLKARSGGCSALGSVGLSGRRWSNPGTQPAHRGVG